MIRIAIVGFKVKLPRLLKKGISGSKFSLKNSVSTNREAEISYPRSLELLRKRYLFRNFDFNHNSSTFIAIVRIQKRIIFLVIS